MSSENVGLKIPSAFQWITSAPTLIGKINRILSAAQTKNWATTAVALVALVAYVGNLIGLPIDETVVKTLEAAALAVIGFFTGKQVVNPQLPDATWQVMQEKTHGTP